MGDKSTTSGMAPSTSSPKNKFKKPSSGAKVMITVFWACEGVIPVATMLRGETSQSYINVLTKHRKHFKRIQLIRIKHKSCFSMAMQGHTQV